MAWFARKWTPSTGQGRDRGMPSPGAGITGRPHVTGAGAPLGSALQVTSDRRTWRNPSSPESLQRGHGVPESPAQRRSPPFRRVAPYGGVFYTHAAPYDHGAADFTPKLGTIFTNPIGAGIMATQRPQASYGFAGQYVHSQIYWSPQTIPASVSLAGLYSPAAINELVNAMLIAPTTPYY